MDMDHLKLCLIFAIMLAVTNAGSECQYSLGGNIETISFTGKNISNYQELEMLQEGDILYIKNLTLINTGDCTLTNISISIWLETPEDDEFYFCKPGFKLDSLEPNETYSFPANPLLIHKGVLICGYRLTKTGAYYMKSDVSADFQGGFGYSMGLNGKFYGADAAVLIVQPIPQLKNLETLNDMLNETRNTAASSQQSSYYALIALIISAIVGAVSIHYYTEDKKHEEEKLNLMRKTADIQIERLDKVAEHIETATNKQLGDMERRELKEFLGIIQMVLTEMDLNDEFIKKLKEREEVFKKDETMMIIAHFSTFSLDRLIAKGHLFDSPEIVKNLHYYRVILSGLNSCLQDIRSSSKIPHKDAINLIFDKYLVDDNIKANKKLRENLEKYEKN